MAETLYQSFSEIAARYQNRIALMHKEEGRYVGTTYKDMKDSVDAVAVTIQKLGIGKGDMVGILSCNRPEWAIADLAVLKLGGIVVPIYPTLPPSYVKYIVNDSKITLIFVENAQLFSLINSIRHETPALKHVVLFDISGLSAEERFLSFDDMKQTESGGILKEAVVSHDDTATIVYTSGTTGEPKGVVLTHGNIVSNARSVSETYQVSCEDIFLSYLPLCHMFERTCGYYTILFAGGTIAYAENLSTVAHDVEEIRPTVFLAVPRVIEKVYDEVVKEVEKSSWIKKTLVFSAIKCLNRSVNLRYKKMKVPITLKVKSSIYKKFVASEFQKLGGGRLRIIASGGAPLNAKVAKVFYVLGFNILEGYGLTETSPVLCLNTVEENRLGTVGKPIDGVEVKCGENDEILVRGPNVMTGYLNKPDETARVIDKEGWLRTGDQGRFDKHGNLVITGRIKEMIITSYGKNIAVGPIEANIARSRHISQVMLCGDKRKYIVALVVPDRSAVENLRGETMPQTDDYAQLLKTDEVKQLIKQEIDNATQDLPSYEKVKAFTLIPEEFTVENRMLTPTLKLRRNVIMARYGIEIESMYVEAGGKGRAF